MAVDNKLRYYSENAKSASYLDKLVQDERIFEDPLNRFDQDGTHVEASNLGLQGLNSFLKHSLDFLKKYGNISTIKRFPCKFAK